MPIRVRVTSSNLLDTKRELQQLKRRIENLSPFWRSIAVPIIKDKLRRIFLEEGPGWAPLLPSTIQSRQYPGLPILQQTGALMASVVDHPVLQVSRRQLLYGTNNPYAEFHEEGTSRMVARPFLRPARRAVMDELRNAFRIYMSRSR